MTEPVPETMIPEDPWEAEWERVLGRIPALARDLHEMNPVAEESYRRLRSWIYEERDDGLSRAHKELVMIVMNLAVGHREGALTHLNHGLEHGLSVTEVRETLSLGFLFLGAIDFLKVGQALWQATALKADGPPGD